MEPYEFAITFFYLLNLMNMLRDANRTRRRRIEEFLRRVRARRRQFAIGQHMFRERLQRKRTLLNRLVQVGARRRLWAHPELLANDPFQSNWEVNVPHYSDKRFLKKFRVSRATFKLLVDAVRPYIERTDTKFRKCIPCEKRVAIALYTLKSNCDFWTIADWFRVGRSTVPYILYEFCEVVNTVLFDVYVKYPSSNEEKLACVEDFYTRWQFPDCFGAIDGTHIPIIQPATINAADYFNYKSFYSVVLLGLVDANYKFTYVNIGRPGKVNDSSIFNRSGLKQELITNQLNHKFHIIGDGAFPIMLPLMKPYTITHGMPLAKKNFNKRLSRARVVVEDAFGRLKGRWRILMKRADIDLENTKLIIKTCVVLHNICESQREPFLDDWREDVAIFDLQYPQPQDIYNEREVHEVASTKRDLLADALLADGIVIQANN